MYFYTVFLFFFMIFDVSFSALLRVSNRMGVCPPSGNPPLCLIMFVLRYCLWFWRKNILLLLLFLSWLKFYSLTIITLCGVSFAAYRERCCRCTRIFRFRICLSRKTDSVRDWASFWTCWLPYQPQIAESASSPVAPYTIPAPQECESPIELTYHLQQPTRRTSTIAQEKFVSETEIFSQNFSENEMLPVEQNGRILRWFTVYLC